MDERVLKPSSELFGKGMCLLLTGSNVSYVMDYLLECVYRHGKSIKEMLCEDSCALDEGGMRYFDHRLCGKVPSYSLWRMFFNGLDADTREEIERQEQEVLQCRYEGEMRNIAQRADGSTEENRIFGYWKRLYDMSDKRIDRVERKSDKRKGREMNEGLKSLEGAYKLLKALDDSQLLRLKGEVERISVSEGVSDE